MTAWELLLGWYHSDPEHRKFSVEVRDVYGGNTLRVILTWRPRYDDPPDRPSTVTTYGGLADGGLSVVEDAIRKWDASEFDPAPG